MDMRQRRVAETLEHLAFKGKALSLSFTRIDDLFKGKELVWNLLISHQINRPESPHAEQILNNITALYDTLYWEDCPSRYVLHVFTSILFCPENYSWSRAQ